jgi:competence protein ComEC
MSAPSFPLLAACLVSASLLLSCATEPDPEPWLAARLTVLDVGQGSAALIESRGEAWLVDAGTPEADVADTLRARGITRLRGLFLTHHHRDHFGGAPRLLRELRVDQVHLSSDPYRTPSWDSLRLLLDSLQLPVDTVLAGDRFELDPEPGKLLLRVLWPGLGDWHQENDASLVLQLKTPLACALLPGDISSEIEARLLELEPELRCELLVAAHHGSATSSSLPFVGAVSPRWVAISVGAGNSYGHPDEGVLADLHLVLGDSSALLRTDRSGSLPFLLDAAGLRPERSPPTEGAAH